MHNWRMRYSSRSSALFSSFSLWTDGRCWCWGSDIGPLVINETVTFATAHRLPLPDLFPFLLLDLLHVFFFFFSPSSSPAGLFPPWLIVHWQDRPVTATLFIHFRAILTGEFLASFFGCPLRLLRPTTLRGPHTTRPYLKRLCYGSLDLFPTTTTTTSNPTGREYLFSISFLDLSIHLSYFHLVISLPMIRIVASCYIVCL